MTIKRLRVRLRRMWRRRGMTPAVLLSLAGHGLVIALLVSWSALEKLPAPRTLALVVDLVEDNAPGSDAPEIPAGAAPAAPVATVAQAPVGAGDATPGAPAKKGGDVPPTPAPTGPEATGSVGDLLRGAETAHGGAAPRAADGAGGVFDTADAGGTGAASLEDFIRVQIARRWQIGPNAPDVHVRLRIRIAADGSVLAAAPVSDSGEDRAYHALAIAARNAALLSSPLQFPRGTIAITGELVVDLSTRDARR